MKWKQASIIAVAAGLTGCAGKTTVTQEAEGRVSPSKEAKITLVYQSNRLGGLEPCGCESKPWGGIDREANALEVIRKSGRDVLFVDAGNMLAPLEAAKRLEHHRSKAATIVGILNQTGLDVFAPGPSDYALGLSALKKLSAQSRFPWVSTNVTAADAPAFAPFVIVEKAGVRYAFLSATPEGAVKDPALSVESPLKALARHLPEARKQADVVVLLSQLGTKADGALVEAEKGFAIVVGSDAERAHDDGLWYGGHTLVVDPHRHGFLLGKLDVDLKLPFRGFFSQSVIAENQKQLAQWKAQLEKNASDQLAKRYVEFLTAKTSLAPIEGGSTYTNELVKLDAERFGQKNAVTALLVKEKERVRKAAIESAE